MTNFEKIKSLNIDEIAKAIIYLGCDDCPLDGKCFGAYEKSCFEKVKEWLESESEDKNNG